MPQLRSSSRSAIEVYELNFVKDRFSGMLHAEETAGIPGHQSAFEPLAGRKPFSGFDLTAQR